MLLMCKHATALFLASLCSDLAPSFHPEELGLLHLPYGSFLARGLFLLSGVPSGQPQPLSRPLFPLLRLPVSLWRLTIYFVICLCLLQVLPFRTQATSCFLLGTSVELPARGALLSLNPVAPFMKVSFETMSSLFLCLHIYYCA